MDSDQICKSGKDTIKDERRSAIVKIAREAFLADGYEATSMSSIAAQAGGSKATLYNHFASKDELFRAVVQDRCSQVAVLLEKGMQEGHDFRESLILAGSHFVSLILSDEFVATYRMVIAAAEKFPDAGQAFYDAGPRQSMARMALRFERAIADGLLRPEDPSVLATTFLHLCKVEIHQRRLFNALPPPNREDVEANVKRAVTIFMAAYGA